MGISDQTVIERYVVIDALRGLAVLLMIFFHLFYDMNLLRLITIDMSENLFWFYLPRFIVSVFLICVGIGLSLVHKHGIRWRHARNRFLRIGGYALLITIVTYLLFPDRFVFFGVLHCIAAAGALGLLFVGYPGVSLSGFLIIIASYMIIDPPMEEFIDLIGITPMDFVPLYPWFGWVLLGIFLEHVHFHQIPLRKTRVMEGLNYMGKHSLIIYLIHQPILFGVCYLVAKLTITERV